MEFTSTIGTILLIFTGLMTYKGFRDGAFFNHYIFDVDKILIGREHVRLLSSGFLHINWIHFGFNMIALMSFSLSLEFALGTMNYLFIYFASLIGGNLFALYIHRNHGDYTAVGASGAISGIILASIVLVPSGEISFILFPGAMKSWIFAVLFLVISIFGIKTQTGNIGHEAHLGGAIIGVLATLAIKPSIFIQNWWIVALILMPTITFLVLIIRSPNMLLVLNYWGDDLQNIKDTLTQKKEGPSLDFLLDKINRSGIDSLTKKERTQLEKLKDEL